MCLLCCSKTAGIRILSPSCLCCLFKPFLFMWCSPVGSFWRLRTCQVPDKASCCLLCPLAGRSGRTTWEEPTLSIMRAEPHSGNDPQSSKTAPPLPNKVTPLSSLVQHWLCLCVLNRDGDVELQRGRNSDMDAEHAFITRRQISDHDENSTRESPEVILTVFKITFRWTGEGSLIW